MNSIFETTKIASDRKYILVRDEPRFEEQKIFLEKLWGSYAPFADINFRDELSLQFHPRFWEMYLACAFIEMGFDLIPRNSSHGPDIQININNRTLWIEAIAPDAGTGADAVPGYPNDDVPQVIRIPEEQIILRLTNSFYKKCEKYEKYINTGIISKDDIFVIAINGFDIPHILGEEEIPYIVKSVLPFGDLTITLDIENMKPIDQFYAYREHIQKKSGKNVITKAFQDEKYSFVSGIIYSVAELWNLPASLGADFLFLHNPIANNFLDKEWIGKGRYIWVENDNLRFGTIPNKNTE